MKAVERVFWTLGLLLVLPFALHHGFKPSSVKQQAAPALHSTAIGGSGSLAGTSSSEPAVRETYQRKEPRAAHAGLVAVHQSFSRPERWLGQLRVPALGIDLPITTSHGGLGSDYAEIINSTGELSSLHHIGLATCFDGDVEALARRITGKRVLLHTPQRLRHYRVIDAQITDLHAPHVSLDLDLRGLTLLSCLSGYGLDGQMLVITAMETDSAYESRPVVLDQGYPSLQF